MKALLFSAVLLALASNAGATPPFVKDPYLIYMGCDSSMTVHWQIEDSDMCLIEWGTDTTYALGSSYTSEYNSDHFHRYDITGLSPGQKYFYRVSCSATQLPGCLCVAPPVNETDIGFLLYGDTRTNYMQHDEIAQLMIDEYTADPMYQSLVVCTGDIVTFGADDSVWQCEMFNDLQTNLRQRMAELPFQSCLGNHELYEVDYTGYNIDTPLFGTYFPYPFVDRRYWSFDYGPAHFVIMDQYPPEYDPYGQGLLPSAELSWLGSDLASTSKPWKFIVLHEPGWSCGPHENNTDVQNLLQPICETYGVQFVLAGHNHYYARACRNGVHHITAGGGGGPLNLPGIGWLNVATATSCYNYCRVEIRSDSLFLTAIKEDGSVIDSFCVDRNETVNYLLGSVSLESGTGQVQNVLVEADGHSEHPDTRGYYGMMLDSGIYTVTASLDGYQTQVFDSVEICAGTETQLNIVMHELTGFEHEAGQGEMTVALGVPHPNPMSSSAAVDFVTVQPGFVRLRVMDITGRLVMMVADQYMNPGQHSVIMDASELSSGMYLVTLSSAGESCTVRALVVH